MNSPILSLHHVTATVDDAQQDLDFYVDVLGLRLVKKTVNFDNRRVYHFYYGNERGAPGTISTTFPYKGQGVRVGTKGAGQVAVTSFSIPRDSLKLWKARLGERGISVRDEEPRFGEDTVVFEDPCGLTIRLVANDRDRREPWASGSVPRKAAIRGLHSVSMLVHAPDKTIEFMTRVLGFTVVNERERRIRVAVGRDEPGKAIDVAHSTDFPQAINGLGTVHHVAFAVANAEDQLRMRKELVAHGCEVTPVMDRQYFTSIYFREPGGVLFEIATLPPGFTVDETVEGLGRELKLPPWEEPNRAQIEAGLPAMKTPAIQNAKFKMQNADPEPSA